MWSYWLMFLIPAWAALNERATRPGVGHSGMSSGTQLSGAWWGVIAALTLLIGWRHEVGGDWFNYLENFRNAIYNSQFGDWWKDDPGYRLLEWLAIRNDWGIHAVNLVAASIFSVGLVRFCRDLPRPWLALAVAVPYLVIILGMGYSRQGIALGCIMAGLVSLGQGRVTHFVLLAVLGATFHKSAVLVLPMAALAASQRRMVTWAWVGLVVAMSYRLLLEDSVGNLQSGYIDAEYQSEGALIRLVMNAVPALLFIWRRDRFAVTQTQGRLWFWFAVASLGLLGLYFVSSSSTAVDRVGLYLLPLQLMVFSYFPEAMNSRGRPGVSSNWVIYVLAYYAAVEFVWLNFATHAFAWLPYRWYPFEW